MEIKEVKKVTKKSSKKGVGRPKKSNDLKVLTKLFNFYFFEYMAYSLMLIMAGIILLTSPAMATRTAEITTAIILIIVGLGNGFNYALKKKIAIFDFCIVYAAISMILGALVIINPFDLIDFLQIAFGVFLIVSGLVKYNFYLTFKYIKEESYRLILGMSIISVLFGVIIIINPFSNLYFTQAIGLFMLVFGVLEMTYTILLKQRSKYFLKHIK